MSASRNTYRVSAAARSSRTAARLLGVLKFRQCLQGVLGRPWEHQFAPLDLELPRRNSHIMPIYPQETSHTDDHIGHRFVRRDNQVLDLTDLLVAVVVHILI